ncbi:hypothetical protein IT408_03375 [Candidatus Uhrbacteria bacterium]|nr:hypothetical protein [Candidatus Uhrbacteria bacterium]
MAKIWTEFCTVCESGRGEQITAGRYELPENKFIRQAQLDTKFRVELLGSICEDLLNVRGRRSFQYATEWMVTRAELNTLRHIGDSLYYDDVCDWFRRNVRHLLCEDKSSALGRLALEVLLSWEEQDADHTNFWIDILSDRCMFGIDIPISWKETALRGLISVDCKLAASRVTCWPDWAPYRYNKALRLVWQNKTARTELIQALFEGKCGPFRSQAEEVHIVLSDMLDSEENKILTNELWRCCEQFDQRKNEISTNPPPASV